MAGGESGNAGLTRYAEDKSCSILVLQLTVAAFMAFFVSLCHLFDNEMRTRSLETNQLCFRAAGGHQSHM